MKNLGRRTRDNFNWFDRVDLWRFGCAERAVYVASGSAYRAVYTFTLPSGGAHAIEARTLSQMGR